MSFSQRKECYTQLNLVEIKAGTNRPHRRRRAAAHLIRKFAFCAWRDANNFPASPFPVTTSQSTAHPPIYPPYSSSPSLSLSRARCARPLHPPSPLWIDIRNSSFVCSAIEGGQHGGSCRCTSLQRNDPTMVLPLFLSLSPLLEGEGKGREKRQGRGLEFMLRAT